MAFGLIFERGISLEIQQAISHLVYAPERMPARRPSQWKSGNLEIATSTSLLSELALGRLEEAVGTEAWGRKTRMTLFPRFMLPWITASTGLIRLRFMDSAIRKRLWRVP